MRARSTCSDSVKWAEISDQARSNASPITATVSMAKDFGQHDPRTYKARSAAYAKAKKVYEKAVRSSEAQRAKDERFAFATVPW